MFKSVGLSFLYLLTCEIENAGERGIVAVRFLLTCETENHFNVAVATLSYITESREIREIKTIVIPLKNRLPIRNLHRIGLGVNPSHISVKKPFTQHQRVWSLNKAKKSLKSKNMAF